jgi:hypothetical protein
VRGPRPTALMEPSRGGAKSVDCVFLNKKCKCIQQTQLFADSIVHVKNQEPHSFGISKPSVLKLLPMSLGHLSKRFRNSVETGFDLGENIAHLRVPRKQKTGQNLGLPQCASGEYDARQFDSLTWFCDKLNRITQEVPELFGLRQSRARI